MKKTYIVTVLLTVIFCGCNSDSDTLKPVEDTTQNIIFTSGQGCAGNPEDRCLRFELKIPTSESLELVKGIEDSIREFAFRHPTTGELLDEKTLKSAINTMYEEAVKENPDNDMRWFIAREAKVISRTEKAVCVSYFESSYLGGAHPNSFTIYKVYNPVNGRRQALSHLFDVSELKKMRVLAEQKFRKQQGMNDTSTYAYNGYWFTGNRFELTDNAALTDSSVIFLYNPYDIASYAQGSISLEIKFAEIKSNNP